jgi:hypothetical protein
MDKARYDVRNCYGTLVESVTVEAYGDKDLDDDYQRCNEVLADAGYDGRARCDVCGDSRFRAVFVGYV